MSTEANKVVIRRWFDEYWNAGKLEVADELLHRDYVSALGYGAGSPSVAASKEGNATWHRILPDIHFTIEDMVAEGDTVVARWTARGTHQGDWETQIGTLPASGKVTATAGTSSYALCDGKIVREVNHIDFENLIAQIGARVVARGSGLYLRQDDPLQTP
jgi:steroid delta-isomerase-like uncharacterized protein